MAEDETMLPSNERELQGQAQASESGTREADNDGGGGGREMEAETVANLMRTPRLLHAPLGADELGNFPRHRLKRLSLLARAYSSMVAGDASAD
jgi:hypothetical protein